MDKTKTDDARKHIRDDIYGPKGKKNQNYQNMRFGNIYIDDITLCRNDLSLH